MRLGLNYKISLGICILVIGLMASVITMGNAVVSEAIDQRIRKDLLTAQQVFNNFQQMRFNQLVTEIDMMVEIPQLKAAVTTPDLDHATILDIADGAGRIIDSDLFIISDRWGRLKASVSEPHRYGDNLRGEPAFQGALQGQSFQGFLRDAKGIYQVVSRPFVFGDDVVGALLIGFTIDEGLIGRFEEMTNAHIALIADHQLITSSVPNPLSISLKKGLWIAMEKRGQIFSRQLNNERYLLLNIPVGISDAFYVLGRSFDKELAFFHRYRQDVLILAGAVLLIALMAGLLFSGRITQPVLSLMKGVQRISAGDFSSRVKSRSHDEVGELAKSFNQMAETLEKTTVSKSYVDNIIKYMGDSLVVLNSDTTIKMVNPVTLSLLGYTETELIGQSIGFIFSGIRDEIPTEQKDNREAFIRKLTQNSSFKQYEANFKAKDGRLIPVLLSGTEMRDPQENTVSVICVARDITLRKKEEEALKKAMQLKSEFTSMVSHELRTPLAISKEALSLMLRGKVGPITPKQTDIVTIAHGNIGRLEDLINDILDFSKLEAGRMELNREWADTAQLVKKTCEEWRLETDAHHIALDCRLPDQPLFLSVDKLKFIQILSNLLNNAIKFTPQGGRIEVAVEEIDDAGRFVVKDTGPGIAKEDIPKLFERFTQLKRKAGPGIQGTGLGLNIVKSLVELHGGRIHIESEPGRGATFVFTIPKEIEGPPR